MNVLLEEDAPDPNSAYPRAGGVPVTVHIQPGTHDWAYAMRALQYSFTFLSGNWRQAAATDSGWPA
jgi:S-formylglutathione hydrolase FrmB